MKRFIRLIALLMAVLTLTTACSNTDLSPQQQKARRDFKIVEDMMSTEDPNFYYEAHSIDELGLVYDGDSSYYPPSEADKIIWPITPVDESFESQINTLGHEVNRYMCEEYNLSNDYMPIKVYWYEDVKILRARYMPQEGVLLINKNCPDAQSIKSNIGTYSLAHELIHYIIHCVMGSPFFHIQDERGWIAGLSLHEAVTEYIAYSFMEKVKHVPPLKILDGAARTNSYELLLYNVDQINEAFGINLVEELLHGNIDEVESEINEYDLPMVVILNGMDIVQGLIIDNKAPDAFIYQSELTQYYFWVARDDSSKTEELCRISEEYVTRVFFLKPELKNPDLAIHAWEIMAYFVE